MKIVWRVLIGLVIVVVLFVLVGFLLPSRVHVERSVVMAASQEVVFNQVNDLRKWHDWSPWHAMEPTATYEYTGPEAGVGSKSSWVGEKIGSGTQEITQSERPTRIRTELDFGPQGKATSEWKFEVEGEGTKVTWGFDTDLGKNPISRYFGLMMDSMIGADYDKGLLRLKEICERDSTVADQDEDAAADTPANREGDMTASPTEVQS